MMKPVDVFAVVVRTIGLLICLWAGAILFWAALNLAGGGPSNVLGLAVIGIPSLGVGLWLLRGAPLIIAFAFPSRLPHERDRSIGERPA